MSRSRCREEKIIFYRIWTIVVIDSLLTKQTRLCRGIYGYYLLYDGVSY